MIGLGDQRASRRIPVACAGLELDEKGQAGAIGRNSCFHPIRERLLGVLIVRERSSIEYRDLFGILWEREPPEKGQSGVARS